MFSLYLILLFFLGALAYRIRGGFKLASWLPWGTQSARMFWCLPTAALVGYLSGSLLVGGEVLVASFLGLMIPHGRQMDMGRAQGTEGEDALHLWCIGVVRVQLILVPLIITFPILSVYWTLLSLVGGLLHPLAYWLAWRLPVRQSWRDRPGCLVDFETAWAELMWGGFQWVLFGLSLPPPWLGVHLPRL